MDKLPLPKLASLRAKRFLMSNNYENSQIHDLNNGKVQLKILNKREPNLEPTENQINAIEYLLKNEDKIFYNIYKYTRDFLYKMLEKFIGVEEPTPYWFPEIKEERDLQRAIGILNIEVDWYDSDDISWVIMNFEFSAAEEHGLSLLFQRDRIVAYGHSFDFGIGSMLVGEELSYYRNNTSLID